MKLFRVQYRLPNDAPHYADRVSHIQAPDADAADREFREGLEDDDLWKVSWFASWRLSNDTRRMHVAS